MARMKTLLAQLSQTPNAHLLQWYPHSLFIALGGWFLAVLCLGAVYLVTFPYLEEPNIALFRQVLLVNFSFTLSFSGPVLFIANRYLGDLLLSRQVERSADMYLGGLTAITLTQVPFAAAYYGLLAGQHGLFRIAATFHYFVLGSLWLLLVFLSALRAYRLASWVFLVSGACSLGFTLLFVKLGSISGMLVGFSSGLLVFVFTLLAYVLAQHRQTSAPLAFLQYFRRYWDLALTGFFFFALLWVDKWAMWLVPGHIHAIAFMPSHRRYENVMVLTMMASLPALMVLIFFQNTVFQDKYQAFYNAIRHHATLEAIQQSYRTLVDTVKQEGWKIFIGQLLVVALFIGGQPGLFQLLDLGDDHRLLFFTGVIAASAQVFLGVSVVLLLMFDFRRQACFLAGSATAVIGGATYWVGFMDPAKHGLGGAAASVLFAFVGLAVLARVFRNLVYHTVVVQSAAQQGL